MVKTPRIPTGGLKGPRSMPRMAMTPMVKKPKVRTGVSPLRLKKIGMPKSATMRSTPNFQAPPMQPQGPQSGPMMP